MQPWLESHVIAMLIAMCGVNACTGFVQETAAVDVGNPGSEHRVLDGMVGDWEVSVRFPIGEGEYGEGKSSCRAEWVLDGRFVRQEYTSTFAGKPLTVVRYLGFDRNLGKYVEIHFESTHTDVMKTEGEISADERTIRCGGGTHVDIFSGKTSSVRTVTEFGDKDSFTIDFFFDDEAGNEASSIRLSHRRKTAPK